MYSELAHAGDASPGQQLEGGLLRGHEQALRVEALIPLW